MKSLKYILFSILGAGLFGIGFISGQTVFNINNLTTDISQTNEDLGIDDSSLLEIETLKKQDEEVINIALFGIDTRVADSDKGTRSDSIIILTIDQINKEIKLSSIMRDTYVKIPGFEKTKINHAYSYGGAQLAIKTLNSNFGLDIRDFVTVDFFGLEKIINAVGGVTLTVEDYEVDEINKYIKEVADIEGVTPTYLSHSGTQKLNGMQAVSYGRIRKVGNGDYERTERQRKVLMALFDTVKNISPTKLIKLVNTCTPYIKTSMDISEGIKIALSVLSGDYTISQNRFPQDDASEGRIINGMWVLAANIPETKNDILEYIYGANVESDDESEEELENYSSNTYKNEREESYKPNSKDKNKKEENENKEIHEDEKVNIDENEEINKDEDEEINKDEDEEINKDEDEYEKVNEDEDFKNSNSSDGNLGNYDDDDN